MSGRRVYARFSPPGRTDGRLRVSRDVAVDVGRGAGAISILSDSAAVCGEELTLALVSQAGERELRVRVVESRPDVSDGTLRHRVRLEILAGGRSAS